MKALIDISMQDVANGMLLQQAHIVPDAKLVRDWMDGQVNVFRLATDWATSFGMIPQPESTASRPVMTVV